MIVLQTMNELNYVTVYCGVDTMKRDPISFALMFEEFVGLMTDPDGMNKEFFGVKLREMCEFFNISKGVTEFYRSLLHEKTGKGEVYIGYDNGRGNKLIHKRRIISKSQAVIQASVYINEDDEPPESEDIKRIDLVMRALLSYISRNRLQQTVEQLGFYDEFGYRNLRYFIRSLWDIRSADRLGGYGAARYNLRHFSLVNRDVGRAGGDLVLRRHYEAMEESVGSSGLVCRVGGDNFVCLFEKDHTDEVVEILKNMPVDLPEHDTRMMVSASAGVYVFPDDFTFETPDDVMDRITSAAQSAKTGSGDILFFDDKMAGMRENMKRVQGQFHDALANEEFMAYYQPKVDIETGRIVGAEALCRWYHDGKVVFPADFIPVLEQNSDICKLDFYMLDQCVP